MSLSTAIDSGSETLTVGVETTLNATDPIVTPGTYQLNVDLSNLASGDTIEIRTKEKTRDTDTASLVLLDTYSDAQSDPHYVSPPMILGEGLSFTLKQTAGTGRTFPWSIRAVT